MLNYAKLFFLMPARVIEIARTKIIQDALNHNPL